MVLTPLVWMFVLEFVSLYFMMTRNNQNVLQNFNLKLEIFAVDKFDYKNKKKRQNEIDQY